MSIHPSSGLLTSKQVARPWGRKIHRQRRSPCLLSSCVFQGWGWVLSVYYYLILLFNFCRSCTRNTVLTTHYCDWSSERPWDLLRSWLFGLTFVGSHFFSCSSAALLSDGSTQCLPRGTSRHVWQSLNWLDDKPAGPGCYPLSPWSTVGVWLLPCLSLTASAPSRWVFCLLLSCVFPLGLFLPLVLAFCNYAIKWSI